MSTEPRQLLSETFDHRKLLGAMLGELFERGVDNDEAADELFAAGLRFTHGYVIDVTGTYGDITDSVDVGSNNEILFMADGRVRFAHNCRIAIPPTTRIRCAPQLQIGQGHTVVTREPLTIVASIACDDCDIHGWVTDGQWVKA